MIDTIIYEEKDHKKKIALTADGKLQELDIIDNERASEGDIYLGKITHKLDLANDKVGFFVNIGDKTDAFLNAEEAGLSDLDLTEGQSLIVQVSQERRAEKGAKLSRSIQVVGQHIVYCPFKMNVGASSKINDKAKLEEYKALVLENTTGQEGWILRTNAVDVAFDVVKSEMKELRAIYDSIRIKARTANAPCLLYTKDGDLFEYLNRHQDTLKKIIVNSHNVEEELKDAVGDDFIIEFSREPFKENLIEDEIAQALEVEVKLRDGGRVYIEETKACVAIDVDTGDDKGNGPISRLNNDAAVEIAKQIMLRNLSGKIIIDFAGSSEYRYLKPCIDILQKELNRDYSRSTVLGLSRAGNVEILRARKRPPLRELLG